MDELSVPTRATVSYPPYVYPCCMPKGGVVTISISCRTQLAGAAPRIAIAGHTVYNVPTVQG